MPKNRKVKECAKAILKIAQSLVGGAEITESKLNELGAEISSRAKALRRLEGVEYSQSLRQAAEQLAKEQEIDLDNDERQLKLQQVINRDLARHMKIFDNKADGITAVLAGSEKPLKGAGSGVEQLSIATERGLLAGSDGWVTKLERGTLLNKFIDPANEIKIADSVLELMDKRKLPTIDESNEIQNIARIVIDKNETERKLQNGYGANIPRNFNRITTTRWSPVKMRQMGVNAFTNLENGLIDWNRSFPEIDPEDRIEALAQFYSDITTGMRVGNSPESVQEIVGRTKFYKRLHQRRVFYFKDGASWVKHMHEVGESSLSEAMLWDTMKAAKNTAFLKRLGPRAELAIQAMINRVKLKHPNTSALKFQYINNILKDLNSISDPAADYRLARIGQNIRRFESWSKLGFATIGSFNDLALQISTLRYNGVGWFDSAKTAIDSAVDLFKSDKDKKDFLELIGTGVENNLGNATRFEALHADHGIMSAMDRIYYRLNYLQKWDKTLKSQTSSMLARHLSQNKELSFAELNKRHRVGLERYNIDEGQWDIMRKHEIKLSNGSTMILPESADRASVDEIKNYIGKDASAPEVKRARDAMHDNLMMYFSDNERHVILDSGSKERAILYLGLPKGTVAGEALRLVTQFKTYSTAFWTRAIGRQLALGLGTKDGVQGMLELIAGTTVLNGASYYTRALIKGQKPDLTNPAVVGNMLAGSFGIFGDLIRDVFDSSDQSFTGGLLGPAAKTTDQVVKFMNKVASWRKTPYKPGSAAWNLAKHNIPFANLYFADAFLRYALLNRISNRIEPGSVERTNAYLQREQGLTSLLPR